MVNWGAHETYPNGHNISEVNWGDHDSSSNHMNEFLLSGVDWGVHDSSFFLFLVNIDYDAKPKEFFTQELWGGLPQRTSSTPLIGWNHVEGKLVHHLALQKGPMQRSPSQLLVYICDPTPRTCPDSLVSYLLQL